MFEGRTYRAFLYCQTRIYSDQTGMAVDNPKKVDKTSYICADISVLKMQLITKEHIISPVPMLRELEGYLQPRVVES